MSVEIEVVENLARACAAMLLGALTGEGQLGLAGGSTPRAAYQELVRVIREVGVDVTGATLWFGDERCVPPGDERSNYRMVRESLLDALDEGGRPQVRRIRGELGPAAAADDYEAQLRSEGPPELDLLLLGIGPDGHTASLFPDQPTLAERSRLAVGVPEAGLEPLVPRVSLTVPAIALARQVVFLASGASKAQAVAAAFGPNAKPDPHVPASIVASAARDVLVLIDPAAAEQL